MYAYNEPYLLNGEENQNSVFWFWPMVQVIYELSYDTHIDILLIKEDLTQ